MRSKFKLGMTVPNDYVHVFVVKRESVCASGGGGAERERESQAGSTFSAEPDSGLNIMTQRS